MVTLDKLVESSLRESGKGPDDVLRLILRSKGATEILDRNKWGLVLPQLDETAAANAGLTLIYVTTDEVTYLRPQDGEYAKQKRSPVLFPDLLKKSYYDAVNFPLETFERGIASAIAVRTAHTVSRFLNSMDYDDPTIGDLAENIHAQADRGQLFIPGVGSGQYHFIWSMFDELGIAIPQYKSISTLQRGPYTGQIVKF